MRLMKESGIEWIGTIPSGRMLIRNKYMLKYVKGRLPSDVNKEGKGFPYIGASDIDDDSGLFENYTEDSSLPNAERDDLLVLWDGARAGIAGTNKEGKLSSTVVKIIPNETVYKPFLYWYYIGFKKYMCDMVNGTTIPHMSRKYVEDIGFIDWPFDEQKRLTDYLDSKCSKIDSIIEKQEAIIEKLKEYKLSVITEAVTKGLDPNVEMKDSGIDLCRQIPSKWEISQIRYLFSLREERNYKPLEDVQLLSLYTDIGVFPHGEQEERGNKAVTAEGYKNVYEDDIIVNIILAWMGAIGRSAYNGVTSPAYDIYKPGSQVCARYYHYLFRTRAFSSECYKYGRGIMAMRWRTYSSEFKSIKVPVPSYSEQKIIADYLDNACDSIDKTIKDRLNSIERLNEYKESLIYEVVTGKKEV